MQQSTYYVAVLNKIENNSCDNNEEVLECMCVTEIDLLSPGKNTGFFVCGTSLIFRSYTKSIGAFAVCVCV